MTERKARKRHICDDARWRKRNDMPLKCSGEIGVGEVYAECPEWQDDVMHPPRYHLACFNRQVAEQQKRVIDFAKNL